MTSPRGEPLGWRDTERCRDGRQGPLGPYGRCATPTRCFGPRRGGGLPRRAVARVDADGVLTGVTGRDGIHEHAGRRHAEAGRRSQAPEDTPDPDASVTA